MTDTRMTLTLRLAFKDEKSGEEVVLFFDHNVPLVVAHRNLVRGGVSISKRKLKALMERAMTIDGGGVH